MAGYDYDYPAFLEAVRDLHGPGCAMRRILEQRLVNGAFEGLMTWVPCDAAGDAGHLDAHHLLKKSILKGERRFGMIYVPAAGTWKAMHRGEVVLEGDEIRTLDDLKMDPRNGMLACRRHHDLIERGLVKLTRDELPVEVEQFAYEVGLEARLERDYGVRS